MERSKSFSFMKVALVAFSLVFGVWTKPIHASNSEKWTAAEQDEIKGVIKSYFESRYISFNTLELPDFEYLLATSPDAKTFLKSELEKLEVEIKHKRLEYLRYLQYEYSLDFKDITIDAASQTSIVSVVEGYDVIFERSAEISPTNPIVSSMRNLDHTFILHNEQGKWKIVSDLYADYLWRMLRETGISTDELLQNMDDPHSSISERTEILTSVVSALPDDESSHPYDRTGAVTYAHRWALEARPYNSPPYHDFTDDGGDCTNFISQAIHEGSSAEMIGSNTYGWYFNNVSDYSPAWTHVDFMYSFITDYFAWEAGPEGYEVSRNQAELGDLIQFDWENDGVWDHGVIIVQSQDDDQGNRFHWVAAHTDDVDNYLFTDYAYTWPNMIYRFIHIERIDGAPPITPTPTITATSTSTATPTATSTITPTTTPTTTVNYALQFNPTDAPKIILMPANTNLDFAMDMTVEFWIRTTSASGSGSWYQAPWILDKDIPGFGGSDWGISIQQGKIRSNLGAVSSAINNGAWRHVAITRDTAAGQNIIYIDGVQDTVAASGAGSISNTLALIVGSENGATGLLSRAFAGSLDELRIWNIARSPADIQANMATALQGNESGLVGYWDFNEGSGQTVFDKSSTQAHGQLGNTSAPDINDPTWISAPELFNGVTPTLVPTTTPFPPNYTPPPNSTPYSTETPPPPTVASTPNGSICPMDILYALLNALTKNTSHLASLNPLPYLQQATFDIELFRRVEDEVLSQTPEGQHYIDLYYGHGAELADLLTTNVDLRNEAVATLNLWEPNLQAIVDGQGGSAVITSGQVQAVQTFLDHLYSAGSAELRQTIDTERAAKPLEQAIGLSMIQASEYFADFQGPPTVTPTNTLTPTPTSTPTTTPTPPPGLIFADGFEGGNFSAWYWADTDGGDFSVTTQAAGSGSYGAQAVIDDNHQLTLYDVSPNNEALYTARFYFDPNAVQISSSSGATGGVNLFNASASAGWAACLYMEQEGDHYSLTLCGEDDAAA